MDGDTSTSLKADAATTATDAAMKQSEKKEKEKDKKQTEFIESCTIPDVLVYVSKPKVLKGIGTLAKGSWLNPLCGRSTHQKTSH